MDSPSVEEEEHQEASLNVPINDHRDLGKSKLLISRASEPELDPANAVEERGEEQKEADQEVVPPSVQFSCESCPKVFSSGKALGGHKRIHSQAKKEHRKKYGKKQARVIAGSSCQSEAKVDRKPITTCQVCKANFPSEKAMSGHMRVHKDRHWRGLQPPERHSRVSPSPSPSSSTSPSSSSAMDEHLSEMNPGDCMDEEPVDVEDRPVVITRRAGVNPNSSFDGEEEKSVEMTEYANVLMLLANGDDRPSGFSHKLEEDAEPRIQPFPVNMGKKIDHGSKARSKGPVLQLEKVKEKKRKLGDSNAGGGDDHGGDSANSKTGMMTRMYRCGICDKVFRSHQAYGGHLSSHNKIKKQTLGPDGALQGWGSAGAGSSSGKAIEQHESHGNMGDRVAGSRNVLDFDLNEPPAAEMDDWEDDDNN